MVVIIAVRNNTPFGSHVLTPNSDDSIGKTCTFKDYPSFNYAASLYCAEFALGVNVPQGNSYGIKIASVPDGYGGQQIFWGEFRTNFDNMIGFDTDRKQETIALTGAATISLLTTSV